MAKRRILIAGAGMAGCFLALSLAKKGYSVQVIEKRDSLSAIMKESGRSFNLTLYYRGILALKTLGIWEEVKAYAEIAEGNVAHLATGKDRYDQFDNTDEVLYTIHRNSLNKALVLAAKKHPLISFQFHTSIASVDKHLKSVTLVDTRTKKAKISPYDVLIGADGAYSMTRTYLQHGQEAKHSLEFSDWAYKEVWISPEKARKMNLRIKATHTWPRDNSLLLAFPNPDGSFTLMFNLPRNGKESFAQLTTTKSIDQYLLKYFPELLPSREEIISTLIHKPLGHFVTVNTSPWFYKESIVLVGDAAHAVLPFYGQGMCAAFEDCLLLTSLMVKHSRNLEKAFTTYQELRKKNTDILAELSVSNFIELRDKTRSEQFVIKDRIYTLLNRILPSLWLPPLYVLIAHRSGTYEESLRLFNRQEKIAKWIGIDVVASLVVLAIKLKKAILQIKSRTSTAVSLQNTSPKIGL